MIVMICAEGIVLTDNDSIVIIYDADEIYHSDHNNQKNLRSLYSTF